MLGFGDLGDRNDLHSLLFLERRAAIVLERLVSRLTIRIHNVSPGRSSGLTSYAAVSAPEGGGNADLMAT